jgi:hypothetical protein
MNDNFSHPDIQELHALAGRGQVAILAHIGIVAVLIVVIFLAIENYLGSREEITAGREPGTFVPTGEQAPAGGPLNRRDPASPGPAAFADDRARTVVLK